MDGRSVVKIFFQPGTNVPRALTEVTAISQSIIRSLPSGISAPLIITYTASAVPILQIGMKGEGLSEQELFDDATNVVRNQMATVPGTSIPWPYGGKQRQVSVNVDIPALQAKGLSPVDVINAVSNQNLALPSGSVKLGPTEYNVELNGSTNTIAALNDLPIKVVNGSTIYVRDVAQVSDGFSPQINIVRMDGQRGVLVTVYKTGTASTLDIVSQIYAKLPQIAALLPPQLVMTPLFDQSIFVRAAIQGVIREGIVAACLTGLMILLFLGNWRSTVIIAISIPLSILVSICVLSALHETINIMTLGGLALAVGILVDDATVEIENINRNLAQGKETVHAILDGAQQIAVPALVSTLSHLHRLCAHVFLDRRGEIPIRAARRSRRFRHAGFLPSLQNARAHHGDVPPEGPSWRRARHRQRHFLPGAARVCPGFRAHARALPQYARVLPAACLDVHELCSCCSAWPPRRSPWFWDATSSLRSTPV